MAGHPFFHRGYVLDGAGGGRPIDAAWSRTWSPDQGLLWVVLDRSHPMTANWLAEQPDLPRVVPGSLLTETPRPRATPHNGGLLVMLRGVNLNPGAEPDDMVALRAWFDRHRVILVQGRPIGAVADVAERIAEGAGPTRSGDVLLQLLEALGDRIDETGSDLSEQADAIEEASGAPTLAPSLRVRIAALRSSCMTMRRYIAPQRDMVGRLVVERCDLLDEFDRARLREAAEQLAHVVEELDLIRERLVIAQEQLVARTSERLGRNTYTLSVVASVFLPLSLLTGLLGINVGGIPLAHSPRGFAVVCLVLAVVVAFEIWLFRRMRWL